MRSVPSTSGVAVGGAAFSDLDYADNIALLTPRHADLKQQLMSIAAASQTLALTVMVV